MKFGQGSQIRASILRPLQRAPAPPAPVVQQPVAFVPIAVAQPGPLVVAPPLPVPAEAAAPIPDPIGVLASLGCVTYDWDINSGDVNFGAHLAQVPSLKMLTRVADDRAFARLVSPSGQVRRREAIRGSTESDAGAGVPFRLAYLLGASLGEQVGIEETGRWFAGLNGKPARAHGLLRAVDPAQAGEAASAVTNFDPLTGLHSRDYLIAQTEHMFEQAARGRSTFAFLLASVDNLSFINHTYGYDIADEVIVEVARALRHQIRSNDLIARYSGNRFALLLEACDGEQMAQAAERFLDVAARQPVTTSIGQLPISLRIGGVVAPRQARGSRALIQHAEEALDIARERATERFVAYMPSLLRDEARLRALTMSDDITSALNERRIRLAFQPVVSAKTGEVAFHEALMRVEKADGTSLAPGVIFPMAEKIGLAHLLDHRVLELAIDALTRDPDLTLAINCSGATAYNPDWPSHLAAMLSSRQGLAERLIVEITETCAIADIAATRRVFGAMKKLGLRIAMDDFGAGHTSFRNLRDLRVDHLKIDGAFVQNLSRSADDRFFVRTLVDLARHLEVETVAEWVEDAEAARILADWGVDYLQGHHFGAAEGRHYGAASQPLVPAATLRFGT